MTCASAWMESALLDPDGGQRWVIYDEARRLMAHPGLLHRVDAQSRLARHYGIVNMLIFHKLTDLDNVGASGTAARALTPLTARQRRNRKSIEAQIQHIRLAHLPTSRAHK